MTVSELQEWIESAKRISAQSGQVIEDYEVVINSAPGEYRDASVEDVRIDHGQNVLRLESQP